MLRNTLFFSSLIGDGARDVGGSIAMNARIWEQVSDHHVAKRHPVLLVEARALTQVRAFSGTSIWTWSMKLRFQMGSNRPLAKRERENVLRGLLAEEVVDPENLLFLEHFVQLSIQ